MRYSSSLVFGLILILSVGSLSAFQKRSKFDQLITISTTFGEMKVVLFDDAPLHKENFLALVKRGYYDSLLFHRVINDFMIQTGDPNSRNAKPRQRLGSGSPSQRIPAEIRPSRTHKKGALAAARKGDQTNPNRESSGSQFYIVKGKVFEEPELERLSMSNFNKAMQKLRESSPEHELIGLFREAYTSGDDASVKALVKSNADEIFKATGIPVSMSAEQVKIYTTLGGTPHLDGQYTIFGEVIVGLEVIDKIVSVSVDARNRPIDDVKIMISVERMKRKKITKHYGYAYN